MNPLILRAARTAYNVNRAYKNGLEGILPPIWMDVPSQHREGLFKAVQALKDKPNITPEQLHEAWWKSKINAGWAFGVLEDSEERTHPNMRPYEELPEAQRQKDLLFRAAVLGILSLETP